MFIEAENPVVFLLFTVVSVFRSGSNSLEGIARFEQSEWQVIYCTYRMYETCPATIECTARYVTRQLRTTHRSRSRC